MGDGIGESAGAETVTMSPSMVLTTVTPCWTSVVTTTGPATVGAAPADVSVPSGDSGAGVSAGLGCAWEVASG